MTPALPLSAMDVALTFGAFYVVYRVAHILLFRGNAPNNASFYTGKRILITGASTGIGKELALQLCRYKPRLVLASRNEAQLKEVARECLEGGAASATTVPTDVSKVDDCKRMVQQAVSAMGGIDILILNAGVSMRCLFADIEEKDMTLFKSMMDVNYFGCIYPTKFALNHLIESRGTIAVLSSMTGVVGAPFRTSYCATKHALHGFYDALRVELAPSNHVKISLLCPSFVDTEIRKNAFRGKEAGFAEEPNMMTVQKCVEITLSHIAAGKRLGFYGFTFSIAPLLKYLWPSMLDKMMAKAARYDGKGHY